MQGEKQVHLLVIDTLFIIETTFLIDMSVTNEFCCYSPYPAVELRAATEHK
jgi:hypothetical protein